MKNKINIGKEYKFLCIRCNDILDRKGDVCCRCILLSYERNIEKQKAELRAITQLANQENPKFLKELKLEARKIACENVSRQYGIKLV